MRRAATVAALAACVAIGCGDEESRLSVPQYVREFKVAADAADEKSDRLESDYRFDPDVSADYTDFFRAEAEVVRELVDDLEDLRPPSGAAAAHDELLEVYGDLSESFQDGRDSDPALEERLEYACSALESAVATEGSPIDLCGRK